MLKQAQRAAVLALTTAFLVGAAPSPTTPTPPARTTPAPRLIVLISVDQMRGDLLQRYATLFTGGFRRLLDHGAYFTAAMHDHAHTETGPGHATLGTGVYPSHSGAVANNFYVRRGAGWRRVYVVQDDSARIVGYPALPGRSPRLLLHTGFADWLKRARPAAKLFSVSGKDRSAILMQGRAHGQAYWFDHGAGRFVTSTYYRRDYPDWLMAMAPRIEAELSADTVWRSTVPAAARRLAQPDTARWEGDGVHSFFPHRFRAERRGPTRADFYGWLGGTPFIDAAVLQVAARAITAESLGADTVPDYLDIGLSQTDYVGHAYGPLSQEQLDNLLRLDRELGDFFAVLDRRVGKGHWVVALTADHGVLTQPEIRARQGRQGERISGGYATRMRRIATAAEAGDTSAAGRARAARALDRLSFVAEAMTSDELGHGAPADSFITLYRRAFRADRPADSLARLGLMVRPGRGDLLTHSTGGTSHGSPYWYDRWVPLVFLGADIAPARISRHAAAVDVAPTLAALAGVPVPDDLDGHALALPTRAAGASH